MFKAGHLLKAIAKEIVLKREMLGMLVQLLVNKMMESSKKVNCKEDYGLALLRSVFQMTLKTIK